MLAINTAFLQANLALSEGQKEVFQDLDAECKHSEHVLKAIDELCDDAKISISDVDEVAVVVGPGSFTGIRIGIAIVKALACANENLKILPLTSLELMAYIVVKNDCARGDFVCAINALSGLFYVAEFDKSGKKLSPERLVDENEFNALKKPVFVLHGDLNGFEDIEISAKDLLEFAKTKHDFVNLSQLKPVYLRLSQAEDDMLKKNKKEHKNI